MYTSDESVVELELEGVRRFDCFDSAGLLVFFISVSISTAGAGLPPADPLKRP
jgi:hypothetical protein